jgi:choline dehydrogenase
VADFRRLEHDLDFPDREWHGADGPLPVRRYRKDERTAVQQAFLDAAAALGFPWVEDHNAPGAMGVGPLPVNSIDGVRQSAAVTYLAEARHRRNLTVMADAEVDRLVLEHGAARGARLIDGRVVRAPLVVLSAGATGARRSCCDRASAQRRTLLASGSRASQTGRVSVAISSTTLWPQLCAQRAHPRLRAARGSR